MLQRVEQLQLTPAPVVEQQSSIKDSLKQWVGLKAAGVAVAVCAVISPFFAEASIANQEQHAPEAFPAVEIVGSHTLPTPNNDKPVVPRASTIEVIEKLFDMPENSVFSVNTPFKQGYITDKLGPYPTASPEEQAYDKYGLFDVYKDFERDHAVAEAYGLTMHNPMPYLRNIMDARELAKKAGEKDAPFEVFRQNAEAYMAEFGIELVFDEPGAYGGKPLTAAEQEHPNVKTNLVDLIRTYATYPQEHIDLSALRTIQLIAHSTVGGYAHMTASDHQSLGVEVYNVVSGAYGHEGGHLASARLMGTKAVAEDKSFRDLGPDIYTVGNPNVYTESMYEDERNGLFRIIDRAIEHGDIETANVLYGQLQAKRELVNITGTGYGAANKKDKGSLVEERADLLKDMTLPITYVMYSKDAYPILHRKLVYTLAQLADYNPNLAYYYLVRGRRSEIPTSSTFDEYLARHTTKNTQPRGDATQFKIISPSLYEQKRKG